MTLPRIFVFYAATLIGLPLVLGLLAGDPWLFIRDFLGLMAKAADVGVTINGRL